MSCWNERLTSMGMLGNEHENKFSQEVVYIPTVIFLLYLPYKQNQRSLKTPRSRIFILMLPMLHHPEIRPYIALIRKKASFPYLIPENQENLHLHCFHPYKDIEKKSFFISVINIEKLAPIQKRRSYESISPPIVFMVHGIASEPHRCFRLDGMSMLLATNSFLICYGNGIHDSFIDFSCEILQNPV